MISEKISQFLPFLLVGFAILLVGCSTTTQTNPSPNSGGEDNAAGDASEVNQEPPEWMNIELTNVLNQETFKLSDFRGKPVLVESFAVWCPFCKQQQLENKKLVEQEGNAIVHVSLDTDPNEDAQKVSEYALANGFNWAYVVSPEEMTSSLRAEFGNSIISAPNVPMILICEDLSYRQLRSGVKNANTLLEEVEKGCF